MSRSTRMRTEKDSMGAVEVPEDALYGAQTQRAIENFPVSGLRFPRAFIHALGLVKQAAAQVNGALGGLPADMTLAIEAASAAVAAGDHDAEFPLDIFQTGSGTSTNMNANEVIAQLAGHSLGDPVDPNDHVNRGQSSNDVIPTTIHVAAAISVHEKLRPALDQLATTIERRASELDGITKTGRTHLMDAMPVTLGQELGAWATQIRENISRLDNAMPRLLQLAIGGTAVGTGINAHPEFGAQVCSVLSGYTGLKFQPAQNRFVAIATQDTAVEVSGHLKTVAVSLMKISNDLRWMNSGPLAGLGEISLPALQPGSSIMPGKVNPVIPEAVAMVSAQVIGNDATITIGGQSGNFQLNVMLPVIAYNLLQSVDLLANAAHLLATRAITGFRANEENISSPLHRNPILVTRLNELIGYQKAAAIAKRAYAEGQPVIEIALEMTELSKEELTELLDPERLAKPLDN